MFRQLCRRGGISTRRWYVMMRSSNVFQTMNSITVVKKSTTSVVFSMMGTSIVLISTNSIDADAVACRGEEANETERNRSISSSSNEQINMTTQTGVIQYMIDDQEKTGRNNRTFMYNLYVPLVYAAVFPLVRTLGRNSLHPKTIQRTQLGLVGFALLHAAYIMFSDSSV